MNTTELSDNAKSILDGYWTLCSPYKAIQYFVEEYESYSEENHPFLIGDDEALNDKQVIALVAELLGHFNSKTEPEKYVDNKESLRAIISAVRKYGLRKRMKR